MITHYKSNFFLVCMKFLYKTIGSGAAGKALTLAQAIQIVIIMDAIVF